MIRNNYTILLLLFGFLTASAQLPAPPAGLSATGYERHIELRWQASTSTGVTNYQIYRSTDGGSNFTLLQSVPASQLAWIDWVGDEGQNLSRQYELRSLAGSNTGTFSTPMTAQTMTMTDEQLLDMVQHATFRYFWDYGHPVSGMARERSTGNPDIVTTGGSGFGVMAIVVGTERGWVSRTDAVNRMLQIVSFLQVADRFHGVFPHWMNGNTGDVYPFSQYDDGADLVETAFLMQGLLTARQYFNQNTPYENALRDVIDGLWEDVEWDWFRKTPNGPVLYWHWSPNYGWQINFQLRGFFEAQIVYLLATASPTHPVPGSLYQSGWTSGSYANPGIYFGHKIYCGPFGGGPLFFAHYSYLGFDPRGWRDNFCNYFVRNRNHALIQQAYSLANPEQHLGYSATAWGLTASDDPFGYLAHDIYPSNDNGTLAPTAALGCMPYTPGESMDALRYFYRQQGERLWGLYGFYDAYNLDQNWFSDAYLAIDQGPIVDMIENQRTGLLWQLFMQNPEIQPALLAMGFQPDNSATKENELQKVGFEVRVLPNPLAMGSPFQVEFSVLEKQVLNLTLTDPQGRHLRTYFQQRDFPVGLSTETLDTRTMLPGLYFLTFQSARGG
ncbi:MAG: glucoamylase family protein, partial [Saprospiraceae bacterium]